jgi:hypothetical protein
LGKRALLAGMMANSGKVSDASNEGNGGVEEGVSHW